MTKRPVLVVLFDGVQSLDVTGPVEVFAGASRLSGEPVYPIRTASLDGSPVRTTSGLRLAADGSLADAWRLPPHTLLVPGGEGTRAPDPRLIEWLRAHAPRAERLLSVCTGALLLAAAGLLDGRRATTHWLSMDQLKALGAEPTGERVVLDGKYVTAAGVSSGIDMALHLVGRVAGDETAQTVQLMTEYDPQPPYDAGSPDKAPAAIVARWRGPGREVS
ncbi:DJ-1/PfpI family protein [Streptomyces sp. NPDC050856]|uniref:DJ-1/PfpI family protein n=1 Tax=Streptomyces sp. NPDC050856 TaxID=3154939 RepID=UPI0033C3B314